MCFLCLCYDNTKYIYSQRGEYTKLKHCGFSSSGSCYREALRRKKRSLPFNKAWLPVWKSSKWQVCKLRQHVCSSSVLLVTFILLKKNEEAFWSCFPIRGGASNGAGFEWWDRWEDVILTCCHGDAEDGKQNREKRRAVQRATACEHIIAISSKLPDES